MKQGLAQKFEVVVVDSREKPPKLPPWPPSKAQKPIPAEDLPDVPAAPACAPARSFWEGCSFFSVSHPWETETLVQCK